MVSAHAQREVNIILVHGLFIGGCAWTHVADALSDRFNVLTPDLPFRSLRSDADCVRALVATSVDKGRPVLLVGHSYGGMVISEAGHHADHLIYVGALAPMPGQTTAEVAGTSVSALCNAAMVPSEDGATISLDREKAVGAWYHLSPPADVAFGLDRHRSAPSSIFAETVEDPAWRHRPSTYVVCAEDRALDPGYQVARGWDMGSAETVRADHSAFFSAPGEVAAILARLAHALTA